MESCGIAFWPLCNGVIGVARSGVPPIARSATRTVAATRPALGLALVLALVVFALAVFVLVVFALVAAASRASPVASATVLVPAVLGVVIGVVGVVVVAVGLFIRRHAVALSRFLLALGRTGCILRILVGVVTPAASTASATASATATTAVTTTVVTGSGDVLLAVVGGIRVALTTGVVRVGSLAGVILFLIWPS